MNQLKSLIDELDIEQLLKLKKELIEGNIERLINKKILSFNWGEENICPVCNRKIDDINNGAYVLYFGAKDFRRKASFCATDCLSYFVEKLSKINMKKIKGENFGTAGNNQNF